MYMIKITKTCTLCKVEKSTDDFYFNTSRDIRYKNKPAWFASQCKDCCKQKQKNKRKNNPNYQKNMDLKHKFGISLEEYNKLKKQQNDCCGLCGLHESTLKKKLAVDHCHSTGKIRGLLCQNCNLGIGNLKDDVEILTKAISYLLKNKLSQY